MTSRKKRRPPGWRVPFLRALRATRNVRQAAWAAGVDHSSVYGYRKRHPEFAAEWAAALGGSAANSPADASLDPSTGLGTGFARDERALKRAPAPFEASDQYIARSSARSGPQMVRVGPGRWSKKAERGFLGELADHANVRRAAAAAGFSTTAVYNRRMNDPVFAAKWAAAKECGRERIDLHLIELANRTLDPDAFEVRDDLPRVTVAEAIQILKLHQASDRGQLGGQRKATREPSIAQVKDEILRRLAAMRRHRERGGGTA